MKTPAGYDEACAAAAAKDGYEPAIALPGTKWPRPLFVYRGPIRGRPPMWQKGDEVRSAIVTQFDCHRQTLPDGRHQLVFNGADGFVYPVYQQKDKR